MFLDIEKAEDFMKMLEAEVDKTIPIFIGQVTQYLPNGIATTQIVIQYQYDHGMIVRYKESLGNVWIPRDASDNLAINMANDVNKKAEEKKMAITALMQQKGYANIISGTWMGI